MKKTEPSTSDTKTLLEHIFVSQVLLLSRQLRADDTVRRKVRNVDYDRKAVQIIRNAREAILFCWNYELPGQDQV